MVYVGANRWFLLMHLGFFRMVVWLFGTEPNKQALRYTKIRGAVVALCVRDQKRKRQRNSPPTVLRGQRLGVGIFFSDSGVDLFWGPILGFKKFFTLCYAVKLRLVNVLTVCAHRRAALLEKIRSVLGILLWVMFCNQRMPPIGSSAVFALSRLLLTPLFNSLIGAPHPTRP